MPGQTYDFVVNTLQSFDTTNQRILEIGCGAKQYKSYISGTYLGLDLPNSIYLDEKPEFACSVHEIPVEGNYFDLVFGVCTFSVVPEPLKAFQECCRVLKPGGQLLIFDYHRRITSVRRKQYPDMQWNEWEFKKLKSMLQAAGFTGKIGLIDSEIPESRKAFFKLPIMRDIRRLILKQMPTQWLLVSATK